MTRLALLVGASLLLTGCAGVGSAGPLLLMASLVLAACDPSGKTPSDPTGPGCSGSMVPSCENGREVLVCCPTGTGCNFDRLCFDHCIPWLATCVDEDATSDTASDACDTYYDEHCVDGQRVAICCPSGTTCNYSRLIVDCPDGSCVTHGETCP